MGNWRTITAATSLAGMNRTIELVRSSGKHYRFYCQEDIDWQIRNRCSIFGWVPGNEQADGGLAVLICRDRPRRYPEVVTVGWKPQGPFVKPWDVATAIIDQAGTWLSIHGYQTLRCIVPKQPGSVIMSQLAQFVYDRLLEDDNTPNPPRLRLLREVDLGDKSAWYCTLR